MQSTELQLTLGDKAHLFGRCRCSSTGELKATATPDHLLEKAVLAQLPKRRKTARREGCY